MTSARPEHTSSGRWHARPAQALLARVLVYALPLAGSIVFVHLASTVVPRPTGSLWLFVAWWIGMSAAATVVLFVIDRFSRRLMPLAALLKLSLVFPDQAPSRLKAALRAGSVQSLERRIALVQQARDAATPAEAAEHLLQLVAALSAHDRVTRGHSERVRGYSVLIGEELSLSRAEIDLLNWAALLHDVGKLDVPEEILNKPSKPSQEEWEVLRRHPLFGEELVQPLRKWLGEWADGVGYHHERWDGRGYPRGLAANDIPLPGRIIAVADVFDVITSARSYKQPSGAVEGRKEIARCAGTQFDPLVVRAFLNASLGRMRLIMGPLSWLAHAPVLGRVPLSPGFGALVGALTVVAVGAGVPTPTEAGQTQRQPPPAAVERPAARAQVEPTSPAVRREIVDRRPRDETAPFPEHPRSTEGSPPATDSPPSPPTGPTGIPPDPPPSFPPQTEQPQQPPVPRPTAVDDAASVREGGSVLVDVLANDVNPAPGWTHITAIGTPEVGSAALESGAIRYHAPSPFVGSTRFMYTIEGASGATSTATVLIDVTPVNDVPAFTAGADQTLLEDAGGQTVPGWASDISAGPANESAQNVTFTVSTSNSSLFSSQPAVASDGTLTYTPAANANGTATITVTARDDGGTADGGVDTSAPATRQISVLSVNDAPAFTAGPDQSIAKNAGPQTISGWATGISPGPTDEASQMVTFSVSNSDSSIFVVQPAVASDGTLTFEARNGNPGTGVVTVTVIARDDGGTANGGVDASPTLTFTITIA